MENKAHAFAAGMFVILVSALLVALAAWLTRDTGVRRVYEISSQEPVTGLQPQAAVRFRGVAVGKVAAIGFDPQTPGNILIRLALEDSAVGAASARAAGLPVVVTRSLYTVMEPVGAVLADLDGLGSDGASAQGAVQGKPWRGVVDLGQLQRWHAQTPSLSPARVIMPSIAWRSMKVFTERGRYLYAPDRSRAMKVAVRGMTWRV